MSGHLLSYARVSTVDQNPQLQLDALDVAGCDRVWTDRVSGSTVSRPQLDELLAYTRPGDTIAVQRLDRLGRSLRHLLEVIEDLEERGIGFRSITESIDTTTATGRLVFAVAPERPSPQLGVSRSTRTRVSALFSAASSSLLLSCS